MKVFAIITPAPAPRTSTVRKAAWVYAAVLVLMVVGQLFEFEKFIPLIESFGIIAGHGGATLLTTLIVVSEVFALPFLLSMYLSPLMRAVSMAMGLVAATLWLYVAIATTVVQNAITNVGFLGTKVHIPVGWWNVLFALLLLAIAAWCSWGMRPLGKYVTHSHKK